MDEIEIIFCCIKIPHNRCNFLRFLWWDESDIKREIFVYEVKTHVFCGVSSPSCSNFELQKSVADSSNQYEWTIASVLERNFCVDTC